MSPIINKPHLIFWISIPILILLAFIHSDNYLDINVYDTMLVISYRHIMYSILILFGILGFGYWLMNRFKFQLSKWLNSIHIIITIGGFLIMLIMALIYREPHNELENLYSNSLTINSVLVILILIIILGQIIYLINIFIGLLRKRNENE